jgi:hypothetical protein
VLGPFIMFNAKLRLLHFIINSLTGPSFHRYHDPGTVPFYLLELESVLLIGAILLDRCSRSWPICFKSGKDINHQLTFHEGKKRRTARFLGEVGV